LDEEGEVADFVGNFMEEDGDGCGGADRRAGVEGGGEGEAVGDVVCEISS